MMNRGRIVFVLVVLLGTLVVGSVALAATTQSLDWRVIGGGGGHAESADGTYALDGTIGQPVVGESSEGGNELCAGFWCGGGEGAQTGRILYLPVVQK